MVADLPPEAWLTALSSLPGMGPASLRALLDAHGPSERAWRAVLDRRVPAGCGTGAAQRGRRDQLVSSWATSAAALDPADFWRRHVDAELGVVIEATAAYPDAFAGDPEPPPILFHLGDPDVVVGARVAIVGTRDCTRYGYDVAFELASTLSSTGVSIVSGLALGIDSAAHAGALDAAGAPPIAVVGSGLDVVYPKRNRVLWRQVARAGVIWTEYPLGSPATGWHFPARNRLLAALADVVVVVESHVTGGALLTASEAMRRDRPVMAVPGAVRSSASRGCNDLLADQGRAAVVRDATDVLVVLGLESRSRRSSAERRPPPSPDDRLVLDAVGWQPATLEHLLLRTGRPLAEVASALQRLEADGWVSPRGGWYERVAKSDG